LSLAVPSIAVERRPRPFLLASAVGLVIVIWALNFIAAKIGLRALPPLSLASLRVTLAAILLIPVYFFRRRISRSGLPAVSTASRRVSPRDVWIFLYLGFFGVAINQICFTAGLQYTSVGHAALIVGMGPVYTLFLAVLLRVERATLVKVAGIGVAFLGVGILASDTGVSARSPSMLGDLIVLAGSLGFATYVVLGKRVASEYDALTMTAFNHFAGALLVLPISVRAARELAAGAAWRSVPWPAWAAALYMALFSSVVAYVIYFWALRYLEATQLSAFTYALPVIATALGVVWLGERTSWVQVCGGILALGGVTWVEAVRSSSS
jgi:drug/metabolite transporter (DMT)-like permease